MELVVYGTKGGFRTLYSTPSAPSIASDLRNNVSSENVLGKSLYAIAFADKGCVFTKYTIVRDTQRSSATGSIAFSLFISSTQKLDGTNVKFLLDKLSNYYADNYVKDNNMNRGEVTTIIQVDWSFVKIILHEYEAKLQNNPPGDMETLQSGAKDAAFIYYADDYKLCKYFDSPFQDEYTDYKLVFFIKEDLQNKPENPLIVMRNSGVELRNIDLENEYCYLNNYDSRKGVTITADGVPRSDKKGSNCIRSKQYVKIKYIKDERYYFPIEAEGTLSNLTSDIYKYLELKNNQIFITYNAFENPPEIPQPVFFEVKDRKGNSINDAEITYKTDYNEERKTKGNSITFKGEDIGKPWKVWAKKGDNLVSEEFTICPLKKDRYDIILHNTKKVDITAKNERGEIFGFIIRIDDDNRYFNIGKNYVIFLDEGIDREYNIDVSKREGNNDYVGSQKCRPEKDSTIQVQLRKSVLPRKERYGIDAGEHGKKAKDSPDYSHDKNGNDLPKGIIIQNKGYKFTKFILDQNKRKNDFDGTLVAQYEKKQSFFTKPKGIVSLIVGVIIIGLGIWTGYTHFFGAAESPQQPPLTRDQIEAYVNGEELLPDTLNDYRKKWKSQKPKNLEERTGRFSFIGIGEKEESDEYTRWKNDSISIANAIDKRKLIDSCNFEKLKNSDVEFSEMQRIFKNTINNLDRSQYVDVKNKLVDVSGLTLTVIADSIKKIISPNVPEAVDENNKQNNEQKQGVKQSTEHKYVTPRQSKQSQIDNTQNVTKELQGSSITKQQLEQYKEANYKQNSSIELYLKFWETVNNSTQKKDFDALLDRVKRDNILKDSELKNYLNSICASSDSFQKFSSILGKSLCESLTELKSKMK